MDLLNFEAFSDFTIVLPDKTYKVHKVVLNRCDYFSSLFSNNNKEVTESQVKFDYDSKLFDIFISCIYSGVDQVDWEPEITNDLLELALYFQYLPLIDNCIEVITKANESNEIFINAIIAHPFIVSKISSSTFNKLCSMNIDHIKSQARFIPDIDLLLKIINALEDTVFDNIADIISSWLEANKVDDIEDVITSHIQDNTYHFNYECFDMRKIYIKELQILANNITSNMLIFASNKKNMSFKLRIKVTENNLIIHYNNRTFNKQINECISFNIKLGDFDIKFRLDEYRVIWMGLNHDVYLFCAFESNGDYIYKRLSMHYEVPLNIMLFGDGVEYKMYGGVI